MALAGGDWVLALLLVASIGSVAVMVDRWKVFQTNKSRADELAQVLADKLGAGDVDGAIRDAKAINNMESRVVVAGLERFAMGHGAVEDYLSAALIRERSVLERRLIVLGTLGNNAPFVGLFGTVLGIIKSFNDLAVTGSSGVSVVMAGISTALVATAFGILVAIPAVVANNYFHNRLDDLTSSSERLSRLVLSHLHSRQSPPRG